MAEPFKNLINPSVVEAVAHHLRRVDQGFDAPRFKALALAGLERLEFKARAQHLAAALLATLPEDVDTCATWLERSLKAVPAPRREHDPDKELGSLGTDDTGVGGWALWAYGEVMAQRGLPHPERALQALHAITQRFTAEFAIRPFLVAHPEVVLRTLHTWQHDPSAHVRRLVSEGSRPRLPWGLRLQALVTDPSPTLPLLDTLQHDPSEYVRRSVANHLNDIGKDHPDVLVDWVQRHRDSASTEHQRLLRHASRHLIKQGHGPMLQAWGVGTPFVGDVTLTLSAPEVRIGHSLELCVTLQSRSPQAQDLEVDVRTHFRKADGQLKPKTFKGRRLSLAPGEQARWVQTLSFKPVSTRPLYIGRQGVDVQVNGQTSQLLHLSLID
ncbi:MAG TPA: DNA alkylation repair protein [Aquabacterium sp.]|uniref:DNA alkylation repair protein n=1 Tax=Aquabacterium sp. TaxID=1872578 RepID=UPI002E2F3819|nr:DNA alkylation repair protein [Aquabacterium sp.]HEX5372418.1 DNA alkylation repair protein [Aquabacterium sp.]